MGEAVALPGEADSPSLGVAGDVLVSVQDDLGREGRMAGHLDGEVAPVPIDDVEVIVVDVGLLLDQLGDLAVAAQLDLPDRG